MAGRLEGKIALVTGIAAGIAAEIALKFAREGAVVFGCDINDTSETVGQARAEGLTIDGVWPIDLTKPAEVTRFVEHAGKAFGRIDILANVAAIPPHLVRVAEMDYETEWLPTMAGEIDLVFLATKAAWPCLVASGNASIINFASVSAFRGSMNFGMAAHCAGKAAVLGMTRQFAVEGGPHNIRANTIAPGMVVTPQTAHAGAVQEDSPVRANILNRLLIKRLGKTDDIAWCAVYLASDEASWVTGANFSVDGGVLAI